MDGRGATLFAAQADACLDIDLSLGFLGGLRTGTDFDPPVWSFGPGCWLDGVNCLNFVPECG